MGWPDKTSPDYQRYFPTSFLNTGYDIIFFWVSRMMFQSLHFTGEVPFKQVVIHGLIRDSQGRKMSKSLGNGIDPLDIIAKYGVDAMRYFITTNTTPGMDMTYSEEKLESAEAYLNKIWNACRYVEGVLGEDFKAAPLEKKDLSVLDAAILDHLEHTIKKVTSKMETYQFGQASSALYDFVYDDFCSNYLEMSKIALSHGGKEEATTKQVLAYVNKAILLMICPFAPFVAEEMYCSLPEHKDSIMLERYPEYDAHFLSKKAADEEKILEAMIKDIRNYKSSQSMAPNAKVRLAVSPKEPFNGSGEYLSRFAFASSYTVKKEALSGTPFLYPGYEMSVEEDIDKATLQAKLEKDKASLEFEVARSEKMLSNPGFVSKAPEAKINAEKEKLDANKKLLAAVMTKLSAL
jgi:valyl-tRNA synthetase